MSEAKNHSNNTSATTLTGEITMETTTQPAQPTQPTVTAGTVTPMSIPNMAANTQQMLAGISQAAGPVLASLQPMVPVIIQAGAVAAGASSPQAAALAATLPALMALYNIGVATPDDLLALVQQVSSRATATTSAVDAALQARGIPPTA